MKRFLIALGLVFASSAAFAGNYPPVPAPTQPYAPQEIPSKIAQMAQNINVYGTGLAYSLPAAVSATANATTQTLGSWTLTANTMTNVGQAYRVRGVFTHGASTNNITPILTFGTFTYTGSVNTTNGGSEMIECTVVRTGVSTQNIACDGQTQVTPIVYSVGAGTASEVADIAINANCTQGTAAVDCILSTFTVEALH